MDGWRQLRNDWLVLLHHECVSSTRAAGANEKAVGAVSSVIDWLEHLLVTAHSLRHTLLHTDFYNFL